MEWLERSRRTGEATKKNFSILKYTPTKTGTAGKLEVTPTGRNTGPTAQGLDELPAVRN